MRKVIGLLAVGLVCMCAVSNAAEPAGKYGYLGIGLGSVPEALADQLGLEKGEGILVTQVRQGSPADKAGIQKNDVITKVDEQIILAEEQLRKLIGYTAPGVEVKVELVRKAKRLTLRATLGATDVAPAARASTGPLTTHGVPLLKDVPGLGQMFIMRRKKGGPLGTIGNITIRGPDGKSLTMTFQGNQGFRKKLDDMLKNGLIDAKTAERMKKAMGLEPQKDGKPQGSVKAKLLKKVSFDFVETPLNEVLAFLRSVGSLNLVVDPAVAKKNPAVTLKVADMELANCLRWICKLVDVEYAVANGTVGVGGADFIAGFRAISPLTSDDAKIGPALQRPLSFDFVDTSLKDVVGFLTGILDVNIVVLGDLKKDEIVNLRLNTVPAGLALKYVGLLTGRNVAVEKQAVTFSAPGERAEKEPGRFSVSIRADGTIDLGGRAVTIGDLGNELAEAVKKDPKLRVAIRADAATRYRTVLEVLEACRNARVKDVSFVAKLKK